MGEEVSFDKVINEAWKIEETELAIRSASRIWVLASIIIPFFAFFEYKYSFERFEHFLYIFLGVSGLMLFRILTQKLIKLPDVVQIYGVSVILAACFSYMAAKTNIENIHNYIMGISAITLVRGMLYFGKVIQLIIVTAINHVMVFVFILVVRKEAISEIPDIGSTLFFGIIFMIFSFAGMRTRYNLTKENFFKSTKIESSMKIIERQKHEVEEKQKEIIDSIHYAKRIQTALITNEKYIDSNMNRLTNKNKES